MRLKGTYGKRLKAGLANPLGMGCWAFGGKGWGGQSEKDSLEVMELALQHGIRHFDTARGYGVSEELVGRFLRDKREEVFLASKVFPPENPADIRKTLETSLEKLQTDFIDLYYLHWPRKGMPIGPQMEVLAGAKEEGLIGAIGVSNYSVDQMEEARSVAPVDFLQSAYHLFWRVIEPEVLTYCREQGIRFVTYSSLGQGILTGKFGSEVAFPKGDNRSRVLHFQDAVWPKVYEAVEKLKPLAAEAGRPLSHLALRWCATRPGVTTVLAGARNRKQIDENAAAFAGQIDTAILDRMTAVSDALLPHLPKQDNIFGAHT